MEASKAEGGQGRVRHDADSTDLPCSGIAHINKVEHSDQGEGEQEGEGVRKRGCWTVRGSKECGRGLAIGPTDP
jgi:hypothetical protein